MDTTPPENAAATAGRTRPTSMKAAFFTSRGGPETISYGQLAVPQLATGTVLVRVEASAVDHVDTFVRSGAYTTELVFPQVVGRDLVGTVERFGPGSAELYASLAPGDGVWSNSMGFAGRPGTAAEFATVPVERLYALPAGVDPIAAAAVLHSGATAYLALHTHAELQEGEVVFIGGAGGGVGQGALIQAIRAGAVVIASCRASDVDHCLGQGASVALDYHSPTFGQQLRAAMERVSGGRGIDVHVETSGRHQLELAVDVLAQRGRIVVLSGVAATNPLPVGKLYMRDGSIRGFAISNATVAELAEAAATVNELLSVGALHARRLTTLPLREAAQAHALMEAGTVRGKIVLLP